MAGTPKKILIVEDDPPQLDVLIDRFKQEGLEVLSAGNGIDGLKMALENHPDIILLDIVMPKMDGLEMFKKLRADEWGKKAQVILLTNLQADDQIMKTVTEYEPSFYLLKTDWKLDEIVARIRLELGMKAAS